MKKNLFLLVVVLNIFVGQSQSDCTIEEIVLLDERPANVSMRQAMELMKGEITGDSIIAERGSQAFYYAMFPSKNLVKDYIIVAKIEKSGNKRFWDVCSKRFEESGEIVIDKTRFFWFCMLALVMYLISFKMIEAFDNNNYKYYWIYLPGYMIVSFMISFILSSAMLGKLIHDFNFVLIEHSIAFTVLCYIIPVGLFFASTKKGRGYFTYLFPKNIKSIA